MGKKYSSSRPAAVLTDTVRPTVACAGKHRGWDAARAIAQRLYASIRGQHDWGRRFEPEASEAVLEQMAGMAPREMRRAWMTAFGNARLDGRGVVELRDLPEGHGKKSPIGFVQ